MAGSDGDSLIWYAAYGSNLLRERFMTYLEGGPVPGTDRSQHGARNGAAPVDDRPYHVDRVLLFGGESRGWGGGGVCFVDADTVEPEATYGRAWLVTVEQLADVWAQENGGTVGPTIDVERLRADGACWFDGRWYARLEYLGELDGRAVATITCETPPALNAAGPAYLEVVGRGLIETWGMDPGAAAAYLATRRGNDGRVDEAVLVARLRAAG